MVTRMPGWYVQAASTVPGPPSGGVRAARSRRDVEVEGRNGRLVGGGVHDRGPGSGTRRRRRGGPGCSRGSSRPRPWPPPSSPRRSRRCTGPGAGPPAGLLPGSRRGGGRARGGPGSRGRSALGVAGHTAMIVSSHDGEARPRPVRTRQGGRGAARAVAPAGHVRRVRGPAEDRRRTSASTPRRRGSAARRSTTSCSPGRRASARRRSPTSSRASWAWPCTSRAARRW